MKRDKIRKKYEGLKKSTFIVNKLYLLMLFLVLGATDWALGFYSLISYVIIYIFYVFTTRLPIENKGDFQYVTHIYKKVEDDELKMDIWYPNTHKKSYPVIFFAHGGGWISGFRNQPNNISWCKYLASNDFVVASIDYRFGIKNNMQDIMDDYDDALIYLKSHGDELRISSQKIILMGLSAGGHLALLYASYYSYKQDKGRMEGIRGVVAYYSPSDLTDLLSSETRSLFAKFATIKTLKGRPSQQPRYYKYYSPIQWISKNMLPVLLVHGKNDATVPFSSSGKLEKKLEKYNVPYKFLIHPNGGHCFETGSKDFHTIRILKLTIGWIRERIGKND